MIVTLEAGADSDAVKRALIERGLWIQRYRNRDGSQVQFLVEPCAPRAAAADLLAIHGVASITEPESSHPRLDLQPATVNVAGIVIGGGDVAEPVLMAGPCSVESEAQVHAAADRLAPAGVRFLRGGAYKPRTSPYSFQGYGAPALQWLRAAADAHGLGVVTEALAVADIDKVAELADLIQIGSRNMHNSPLLRAAGATGKTILLKRGMSATVAEWLSAAEYCLLSGARAVIFCERGIRSFDSSTRNVLDLGAVALLAHSYHLPVIVDPSHATGRRDLIAPLSRAAIASGAAGLLIETHDDPGSALSDGPQALRTSELAALAKELGRTGRGADA